MEDLSRFNEQIAGLVGVRGGSDETFFEILGIEGEGMTTYFPSMKDGVEVPYQIGHDAEYWANKVRAERYTIRLTVSGNAVSAEASLKENGWKCMATGPTNVDVYVDPSNVTNPTLV